MCKGPQAGKRDSKEATTAGVQRARERKWWQKVENRVGNTQGLAGLADCERSFWRIWIRSRAWYDLYLNLELPLWLFCGSQETEPVFQTPCGNGSSKVKETGTLDTYFGGRTHRFADRLGGCLLTVTQPSHRSSSYPQGLGSQASTGQPNKNTDGDSPCRKPALKSKGESEEGFPFQGRQRMEAWVGSVYMEWLRIPKEVKGGGGLQGADLAESPCNAHQLNFQNTSIAFCLCRVLYSVHKRCHAIVPAPWVVRVGIIWRDNPEPVRRGDDIYEEAGSLMIQT